MSSLETTTPLRMLGLTALSGLTSPQEGMPTPLAVWFRSRFAQGGSRISSEEGPQKGFPCAEPCRRSGHPEGHLLITEGSQRRRTVLTLSLPEGFE